jgi:hypothetical protein
VDKRDPNSTEPSRDGHIAALKRELAGYEAAGREDRAAAVRVELARLTGRKDPDAEPVERAVAAAPEQATSPRPRKATAKRKAT